MCGTVTAVQCSDGPCAVDRTLQIQLLTNHCSITCRVVFRTSTSSSMTLSVWWWRGRWGRNRAGEPSIRTQDAGTARCTSLPMPLVSSNCNSSSSSGSDGSSSGSSSSNSSSCGGCSRCCGVVVVVVIVVALHPTPPHPTPASCFRQRGSFVADCIQDFPLAKSLSSNGLIPKRRRLTH